MLALVAWGARESAAGSTAPYAGSNYRWSDHWNASRTLPSESSLRMHDRPVPRTFLSLRRSVHALVGRRARDVLYLQLSHLVARRVALDARRPVSITLRIPGTVSEVSATLVASTMRRPPLRASAPLLLDRKPPGQRRSPRLPPRKACARGFAEADPTSRESRAPRAGIQGCRRTLRAEVLARGDDRLLERLLVMAAVRLRESAASTAQLASDVGHESDAAFTRAFKRAFGTTPAAWRKHG